jgi:nitrite reductase (NO-forming)
MEHHLNRRTLSFMFATMAALPGVALFAVRGGVAQDAGSEASPQASPGASPAACATPNAMPTTDATPAAGCVNEATIGAYDIYFDPKEVTIPADTDVRVNLPNHGATLHNFSITDHKNENLPFDPIDIDIAPGKTEQVTINAPAGAYYFFCDIPGHEAAGMWGTMTVE